MKTKTPILQRIATLLAGTVLMIAAVAALAGCDRHRDHRIHDQYYSEVRPYYQSAPVIVHRPAPYRGDRGYGRHSGRHDGYRRR